MTGYQLIIYDGSYTLTFDSTTNANRVVSRVYSRELNKPATLTVQLENGNYLGAQNMLSASFAGWSGGHTGELKLGMVCGYSLYPTEFSTGADGSLTQYFYGYLAEMSQSGDGVLTLKFYDYLKKYDYLTQPLTFFTSIRDQYARDVAICTSPTAYAGYMVIEDIDSTAELPAVDVSLIADDELIDFGLGTGATGSSTITLNEVGDKGAQAFISSATHTLGALVYYFSSQPGAEANVLRVSVQGDNGSNRPDGTDLFYADITTTASAYTREFAYWNAGEDFEQLVPNKKYWLVYALQSTDGVDPGYVYVRREGAGTYACDSYGAHCYSYDVTGAAWSELDGNLVIAPYMGTASTVDPKDYVRVTSAAPTEDLVILRLPGAYPGLADPPEELSAVSSADRGRVTYYYGTIEIDTIMRNLINQDPDVSGVLVDSDIDATCAVYRTAGKSYGDCLRELCDLYAFNDTGYYQCAMYHRDISGGAYIDAGRRKVIAGTKDSSVMTFAFEASAASDNEKRIISADLRKSTIERPSGVVVMGRGPDGRTIYASRDDRGLGTDSYRTLSKTQNTLTIRDESITSLSAANTRAYAALDDMETNYWEGTILVTGCYPQLFSTAAETEGSGEIITIDDPRFGISEDKFAVLAIDVDETTTRITVSNRPKLTSNWLMELRGRALRTESFVSGDPETERFVHIYKSTVVTDSTLYMRLCSADGTDLTGFAQQTPYRVLCTRMTTPTGITDYNTYTYHAEFDGYNGYGTIERIELWTAASGGTERAEFDFSTELDSSSEIYKAKGMRIVVDFAVEKA